MSERPSAGQSAYIERTLRHEGGYVNHPNDRGGPTNLGITQATLTGHLGRPATAQDVRNLTREQAIEIYFRNYVLRPGLDKINDVRTQGHVFDCCVLHGPARGVQFLQKGLGLTPDGKLGPVTARSVNGAPDHVKLNALILKARLEHFAAICQRDASQNVFLMGWVRRAVGAFLNFLGDDHG